MSLVALASPALAAEVGQPADGLADPAYNPYVLAVGGYFKFTGLELRRDDLQVLRLCLANPSSRLRPR